MRKLFSKASLRLVASLAMAVAFAHAHAQSFPSRPVKIIVPYATGGSSDVLARQLAAKLQDLWKQPISVESRPGASGLIGTEAVVHAAADGYTLLLQNNTMLVQQALAAKPTYDPNKDLTPIMMLGQTPMAIVANPAAGITSIADVVSYRNKHPAALAYGSCGAATPHQFLMELVKQTAGFEATHVPYKGCSPAVTDVLANQVPMAIVSANIAAPYVAARQLVGVAVSTAARYDAMPATRSLAEQGLTSLDYTTWYALMGPARLPAPVLARITADVEAVLAMPDVKQNLVTAGVARYEGDAAALAKVIASDQVFYRDVAKSAGIKAE